MGGSCKMSFEYIILLISVVDLSLLVYMLVCHREMRRVVVNLLKMNKSE